MKCATRKVKCVMRKTGVSLITVLLLMLVATIAATATYKWITSEGRSSASRLRQSEAYQSAVAGIENTRSWMTFHANDVGALIRQYMNDQSNPRKAINLDSRLRSFQQAGQDYHVWLTGVNVDGNTYKLKILSSGEAANGSRHNEAAILVVDGLYQVTLPQTEHHAHIDFDFAYYGGSYTSSGKTVMTSGVVNGNWSGNPPEVTNNWIVTGNATLSGNDLKVGQTTCIGGNLSVENNGITTTDLYVGGEFDGLIKRASGSVYFNGDAKHSGTGSMVIDGNLTVNNIYSTAQNATDRATRVGGNLCVSDSGTILSKGVSDVFQVSGNVWMPGPQNLWYGSVDKYGCVCNIYSPAWASDASHLVSSGTPCTKSGADWGEGRNYVQTSCTGKRLAASDGDVNTNKGSFNKIILGTDASSEVYINSAITTSTYNSLAARSYTENSTWKRNCPEANKISTNDEFSITIGDGGSNHERYPAAKNLCGSWSAPQWHPTGLTDDYYPTYTRGWNNWGGSSYAPYSPAVAVSDTMFAMYYTGGVEDVKFGTYNLTDWKVFKSGVDSRIKLGYVRGDGSRFNSNVFKPVSSEISNKFSSPAVIGAYIVGGELFFDPRDNAYKGYNYDIAAGKATGSPFCRKKSGNDWEPECRVTPWFKSKGTVSSSMPNEREFGCAEDVMTNCFEIWEPSDNGCDNSKYFVDDPLVTCYDDYLPYAEKGCAASITTWPQSGFETALNNCYSQTVEDDSLRAANLYGGYLVVHITGANPGYNYGTSGTLNGKFLIIVDNRVKAQNGFPKTSADSKVFLYLEQGADKIQGTLEHYFIYTKVNTGTSDQLNLTGTLYSPAELCVTNRFQSSTLTVDLPLIQDLRDAGIITENDGSASCGSGGGGGAGAGGGGGAGGGAGGGGDVVIIDSDTKDAYYISMAPQLGVYVETQYESGETLPAGNNNVDVVDSSFVVLPRVIYLPRDPYGTLSDYYSIVPLNGSSLQQSGVNIQCPAGLPTDGDLYSGTLLDQKVYRCTASASGYTSVPFWVAVSEVLRGTPQVYFVESVQEMAPSGSAEVHAYIPPHANSITVLVSCPTSLPGGWTVNPYNADPSPAAGVCSFTFLPGQEGAQKLFDVTTSGASNGTIFFQLLHGEGYALSNPFISELHVSNVATINRIDPTPEEIDAYCEAIPDDCPEVGHRDASEWPDCKVDSITWIKPSTYASIVDTNNSWTIPAGGAGQLTLIEDEPIPGCVVIIPMDNNTLSRDTVKADRFYELRAIAKAKKSSVKVGFAGDVGGRNANVVIASGSREVSCFYEDVKDSVPKACTLDLYTGDTVEVSISKTDGRNSDFNYWKCENNGGNTCPTTDPISSAAYRKFTIKDNRAIIYAHFGEVDQHCFFDEFKQGGVECHAGNQQYCIDKCGNNANSVCVNALDDGSYSDSKWHLVEGSLSSIEDSYERISIDNDASRGDNRANREAVKVMSTTKPGLRGTLKALVQLPKATASYGSLSNNISKSGFLLHSNTTGTEFLMLNVFVNTAGKLAANVCVNGQGGECRSETPKRNGNTLDVSPSSMVMVEATLTDSNTLELTVFSGNYYGTPDTYTSSIKLYELSTTYSDREHEYLGFSMADPNFKIYGIGWNSDDYGADECWDTFPTVKCSFSAKATNGVIPTDTIVEPWLGHSGWFDSKNCTPEYYYYNGTDACSGQAGIEVGCPNSGFYFSGEGAGQHGYRDNGEDVKAAKAWLSCLSNDDQVVAWAAGTETRRAHCGLFWTGKFAECTNHADFGVLASISSGLEGTLTLVGTANLRDARLNITLENPNNSEVEVWLLSENATWGADNFASNSVKFTGTSVSFDVGTSFVEGAQGFDPEHVKQVVVKNLDDYSVTNVSVTSTCSHAVGISNCQAAYNNQTGKWEISADVSNSGKVSAYAITGQVSSSDVVSSTDEPTEWNDSRATWKITHNPYGSYQGSTFDFTASVTNASGETFSTSCGSVTIGSTTCSNYSSSNIASGAAWPAFNFRLNNCPQNSCDYDIYFDGSLLSGNSACTDGSCSGSCSNTGCNSLAKTKEGNAEECTTDGGCSHTYEVRSSNDDKPFTPCEVSFKVAKKVSTEVTATCSVGGSLYQGQQLTLNVSNITNVPNLNNNVQMVWTFNGSSKTIDCGSSNCWNNTITAPAPGTYSYSLSYNGNPVEGCSGTVEIGSILTCSVSPTTVDKDGTYAFTANAAVGCSNCSFTDATGAVENNLSLQAGGSLTRNKTASSTGSKTLSFACNSCNNNVSTSCSASLTVNAVAPSFSCPTNQTETVSTSVSITPQNLTGCEDGCSYTISGTSITGNGYTGGALPGFVGPSSAGTVSYTVSLTNTAGTASHNCSITYNAATPVICHCADYCGSGCEDNIVTGNVFQNPFTGCIFVVSATRLDINQGYTVNGSTPSTGQLCYDNATNCSNALANYSAVDGGWYFYVVNKYTDVRSTGYNPCAPNVQPVLDDCPVVSTTVSPGSPVVITPALSTDCNTQNGCTYAISGDFSTTGSYRAGNIEFTDTGASNGSSRNYSLVISNSEGSSGACSIGPITYSAAASIQITKGDNNVSVPCGKTIHLTGTCNENTWGPFYLHVECSGQFTKTVGGVSAGQYNVVNYGAGNAYNGMDVNLTTSCDPSPNTMSCKAWCDWNP